MANNSELLEATVAEALSGHHCVSGWLGYGNALFLGFGSEPLPERDAGGRRVRPPYELQTSLAGWRVAGDVPASSDDEDERAERAIKSLVGRAVRDWRLDDRRGLEVWFVGGGRLELLPPSEVDPEWADLNEWWFCVPGSCFIGVGSGGRVVAGRTDRPASSQGT